ncbi:MAG: polyprenyl diphosphate synthase [Pseudomonadota bacterium]
MNSAKPIPRHIAIIMDGNGRWAKDRGLHRTRGHQEGAKRVDDIVTECCSLGVEYLTLYTFSTENWQRPSLEVRVLMRLLVRHLKTMDKKLKSNGVSLSAQGTLSRLPDFVLNELNRVIEFTRLEKPKMQLSLALSYGGRQEIIDAIKKISIAVKAGKLDLEMLDETVVRNNLYHPHFPDPDLLIRTGGESRISNFLLWQLAYSEIVVMNELWPDFHPENLRAAIEIFSTRKRRFGKTQEQVEKPQASTKKKQKKELEEKQL